MFSGSAQSAGKATALPPSAQPPKKSVHAKAPDDLAELDFGEEEPGIRDQRYPEEETRELSSEPKPMVHFPAEPEEAGDTADHEAIHVRPAGESGFHPVSVTSPVVASLSIPEAALKAYNRGNYYAEGDRFKEAIEFYREALKIEPRFADAYVGLSTAHIRTNQWENALEESRQALEMPERFLHPANRVQAHYNLAAAYCVTDDLKAAQSHYLEVEKSHHPESATLKAYLGKNCTNPNRRSRFPFLKPFMGL